MTALPSHPDMNDLRMSDKAKPLYEKVLAFLRDEIEPVSTRFDQLHEKRPGPWEWHPEQLEILDGLKRKAGDAGLWNFFLPDAETGEGLSNLDYAFIAAELGKYRIASEALNCSAPDTGTMDVLERVGTPEQKKQAE
jgi:acyl-CoA dehydrogenase